MHFNCVFLAISYARFRRLMSWDSCDSPRMMPLSIGRRYFCIFSTTNPFAFTATARISELPPSELCTSSIAAFIMAEHMANGTILRSISSFISESSSLSSPTPLPAAITASVSTFSSASSFKPSKILSAPTSPCFFTKRYASLPELLTTENILFSRILVRTLFMNASEPNRTASGTNASAKVVGDADIDFPFGGDMCVPFEFIECNDVGGLMLLSLSSPFTADIIDITFNGFIDCFVARSLRSRFLSLVFSIISFILFTPLRTSCSVPSTTKPVGIFTSTVTVAPVTIRIKSNFSCDDTTLKKFLQSCRLVTFGCCCCS